MLLNSKQLIGLPVVTRSGTAVGKVTGFDFDADSGQLSSLRVKTRGLVPGLLDQELIVAWNQVVEVTAEKVVVEDGTAPIRGRAFAVRPAPSAGVHLAKRA